MRLCTLFYRSYPGPYLHSAQVCVLVPSSLLHCIATPRLQLRSQTPS